MVSYMNVHTKVKPEVKKETANKVTKRPNPSWVGHMTNGFGFLIPIRFISLRVI